MKTQVLNKEGLSTYDQEIKDYIKSQGMGVTLEEIKALIDSSDKNTTYTLTKNENNEIVLTGSDGSITSVTDTDTNTWRGIQNNLTSDSTTDSLSAAQGKVLKDLVDGKAASSHTHNYAGSSSVGGSATSAVKLDSSAGSATQPVYFSGGKPVACTYTLGKSVPSNAVFTDTVYDDSSLSSKVTQNTKDISALKTADNVLSSRIDAFTSLTQGSTTGDAELIDIRIGADGTPYNNAGSAVRGQINTLRSEILQTYEIASVDEINNYLGIEVV